MLVPLALVVVAIGALMLLRFPDRPGGNVRLWGLEVGSIGAGLPLMVLGVFVVMLAALAGVHNSEDPRASAGTDGGGSAGTPSPTRHTDPSVPEPVSSPTSPAQPALLPMRSRAVMITTPPGKEVPHCWLFRGNARLGAGKTLVVASRRLKPPAEKTYFQAATWTGAIGKSNWRAPRYFGTQAGQTYRVFVLAMTTHALDHILQAHGSPGQTWDDPNLPRVGTELLQRRDVRQVPGMGTC